MQLFIVRHASIEKHYAGMYIGSTDVSLSKEGVRQAHRLGRFLKNKNINVFYTSSLKRAVQTSRIIAEYISCSPKKVSKIAEISFGDWEKKKASQVNLNNWQGESYDHFAQRVKNFLAELIKQHKNDTVLIVAHAGINREILRAFLRLPEDIVIKQDYGCVNALCLSEAEIHMDGINVVI